MGAWSEYPLCNDYVLDDLGSLRNTNDTRNVVERVLYNKDGYLGNFEIGGLLLDSCIGTTYVCNKNGINKQLNIIKASVKDNIMHYDEEGNSGFCESIESLIAFCSLPIEYRKKLLTEVLKLFELYNKNGVYKKDLSIWVDQSRRSKIYMQVWGQLTKLQETQDFSKAIVINKDAFDKFCIIYRFFEYYTDTCGNTENYLSLLPDNSIKVHGINKKMSEYSTRYDISSGDSPLKGLIGKDKLEILISNNKVITNDNINKPSKATTVGALQVIITDVIKKSTTTIGYNIKDRQGNQRYVPADVLKNAVRNNKVDVLNYTLTSDNRFTPSKRSR